MGNVPAINTCNGFYYYQLTPNSNKRPKMLIEMFCRRSRFLTPWPSQEVYHRHTTKVLVKIGYQQGYTGTFTRNLVYNGVFSSFNSQLHRCFSGIVIFFALGDI